MLVLLQAFFYLAPVISNYTLMDVSQSTPKPTRPLYSIATIGLAAFLGGPLGACYVLHYNFKVLEQHDHAKWTWIIGGVVTLFLLVGMIGLPAEAVQQLPQFLVPTVTVGVTVGIAHYFQGTALELQQDERLPAAPMWKAALIALGFTLLTLLGIFLLSFVLPTGDETAYQEQFDRFYTNEEESLKFYDLLESNVNDSTLLQELEQSCIPLWKENITLAEGFLAVDGLEDPEGDVARLLEYAELRLAIFENSRLLLMKDTTTIEPLLDSLYSRLETVQSAMGSY